MSVTSVDRVFPLRVLGTVTLGAALVLVAGLAGAVDPLLAVAVAVGAAALVPAVALICLALAVHATGSFASCRGAGFLGVGVFASGAAVATLPLVDSGSRAFVAVTGLALAAAAYLLGLLLLPGVATTLMARLRRAFDGISIGVSLSLTAWLLLPAGHAGHQATYAAALIAAAGLSTSTVTVLRSTRRRAATVRCGVGVASAVVGLMLLVGAVEYAAPPGVLVAAAAPVVAGPAVIWAGARRSGATPHASGPASADGTFAGYPMLALPVGAAVLAAAYHLAVVGPPDRTAALLAMAVGASLAVREILAATDVRRYARRVAAQEAHLRALVAGASDVAMVLGDDLRVRWQSPAAARQLGLYDPDVVDHPFLDLVHPDDATGVADRLRAALAAGPGRDPGREPGRGPGGDPGRDPGRPVLVEARIIDGYGHWRETESTISDLRATPEVGALVVHVRDVGERRQLERTLDRLASTDHLTGLPNRRELTRAITNRQRAGHRSGALLVIDLHGLVGVNDLRGRAAGEAVLVEAALRLRTQAGPEDLVSRLGEGQFAVVTGDDAIEAYALGVRLLATLTGPYELPDRPVQLQASAGLTALPPGISPDSVVRRGTLAVRQASQLGRNRIEWYDESLEHQLVRRLDLERHLPGAAGRGELDLVYQPVTELASERPVGVEALVRWRHPVLGTVLPGELLPVADKLQVSEEIGEWVLHAACRQAAAWRRDGHDLWLGVNVSARQLAADFVPEVAAALSVHEIPPERLTVEISDVELSERHRDAAVWGTAAGGRVAGPVAEDRPRPAPFDRADDLPMIAMYLGKLRALGVRTALDDFGAGHTDLVRLRRLPLDVVKLAAPSATGSPDGLATAVVDLARRLGLTVVAEGLETPDHLALVRGAGCRYGQGYLVARPAPAERIEAYLASQRELSR